MYGYCGGGSGGSLFDVGRGVYFWVKGGGRGEGGQMELGWAGLARVGQVEPIIKEVRAMAELRSVRRQHVKS
jgi:hypothetical protein